MGFRDAIFDHKPGASFKRTAVGSDVANGIIRKLSLRIPVANSDPTMQPSISNILGLRSEAKMVRIDTGSIAPAMVTAGHEARYYQNQDTHGVLAAAFEAAPPLTALLENPNAD